MNETVKKKKFSFRRSLKLKMTCAIMSIVAILLVSSIISVVELRRMNNYVTDLIEQNLNSIAVTSELSQQCEEYNLRILAAIGDADSLKTSVPYFDTERFLARCDSLHDSSTSQEVRQATDSLCYSFAAYMLTSLEMEDVAKSSFIRSRDWFFNRLEPRFERLKADIARLNEINYDILQNNSLTFDDNLYRSIAPELVAIGAGILLAILLLYFVIKLYINPLERMLEELEFYRRNARPYKYDFQGDDVLDALNKGIADIAQSNDSLKRRLKALSNTKTDSKE